MTAGRALRAREALLALGVGCALPGGVALTTATGTGAQRLLATASAPSGDPAAAITGLAALVAAGIAGWLTLSLALVLLARLPGRLGALSRLARDRVTPAIVRRWAAIVLGASVTASVLPGTAVAAVRVVDASEPPAPGWRPSPGAGDAPSPTSSPNSTSAPTRSAPPAPRAPSPTSTPAPRASQAPAPGWLPTTRPSTTSRAATPPSSTSPSSTTPGRTGPRVTTTAPAPGWTPSRPRARQRTDPTLLTGRQRPSSTREVVVRRGETLWSIAATHLGPGATDAEVAAAWPRWHAANSAVIGRDPHHLLPGTRLTPPSHDHDPGTVPATRGTP